VAAMIAARQRMTIAVVTLALPRRFPPGSRHECREAGRGGVWPLLSWRLDHLRGAGRVG